MTSCCWIKMNTQKQKKSNDFFYWAHKKTKKFFLLTRAAPQALEVIIIMMKIHEGRASEGEYLIILIMDFVTNKKLTQGIFLSWWTLYVFLKIIIFWVKITMKINQIENIQILTCFVIIVLYMYHVSLLAKRNKKR